MYSGMAKGTSRAEATLNSEKIKPVALAIVELRESEGIREGGMEAGRQAGRRAGGRAGRQLVSWSKIPLNNFFKIL